MRKIKKILVSSLLSVASMCTLPVVVNATIRSKKANNFIASNDSRKYVNFLNTETTIHDEHVEKEKVFIEVCESLSKFYPLSTDRFYSIDIDYYLDNLAMTIDFYMIGEINLKQNIEEYVKLLGNSVDLYNSLIDSENEKIAECKRYFLNHEDGKDNASSINNAEKEYYDLLFECCEKRIKHLINAKVIVECKMNWKNMLDEANEKINALQCAKEKINAIIKNFKNN